MMEATSIRAAEIDSAKQVEISEQEVSILEVRRIQSTAIPQNHLENDGHGLPFDVSGSQQDVIHTVVSGPLNVSFGDSELRAFEDVPVDPAAGFDGEVEKSEEFFGREEASGDFGCFF
jgi:hypothetical protein